MNIMFLTQSQALEVFHATLSKLKEVTTVGKVGWFVADHAYFRSFTKRCDFRPDAVAKEWEIVATAMKNPQLARRAGEVESSLGVETLWPTLIADRRVFEGPMSKVRQDYASSFDHDQMAAQAVATFDKLQDVFEQVSPDVVVSFGPNTLGSMMGAWIARSRSVPCLTLKSTKIGNLVTLSADYAERHAHIAERYNAFRQGDMPSDAARTYADTFLEAVKKSGASYEGVAILPHTFPIVDQLRRFAAKLPAALASDLTSPQYDPQRMPQVPTLYHSTFGRTFRARASKRVIGSRFILPETLKEQSYVFFPLNSEPEIALSVYSLFYRNQIEVARVIAQSLPLNMKLVIKDHPRSWGLRSPGYYRKLLGIPNVAIVPVEVPTAVLIRNARAVVALSSFVGLEAIFAGKPAIMLGNTMYDMLPRPYLWKVDSLPHLPAILKQAMETPAAGEDGVLAHFIAAVFEQSIPLDLYSQLLNKGGRGKGTQAIAADKKDQYRLLADFIVARWKSVRRLHQAAA